MVFFCCLVYVAAYNYTMDGYGSHSFFHSFIRSIDRLTEKEKIKQTHSITTTTTTSVTTTNCHTHTSLSIQCSIAVVFIIWYDEKKMVRFRYNFFMFYCFFFIWNDTTFLNSQTKTKQKKSEFRMSTHAQSLSFFFRSNERINRSHQYWFLSLFLPLHRGYPKSKSFLLWHFHTHTHIHHRPTKTYWNQSNRQTKPLYNQN